MAFEEEIENDSQETLDNYRIFSSLLGLPFTHKSG